MGDRLMSDDDIEALCICGLAHKGNAVEFQVPHAEKSWKTVIYFHKECPLHGITRFPAKGVSNAS